MPLDRFLHPRLGHSAKVCGLSDLQFRVWVQYQLTADDFGVMRATAITVQATNDALAQRSVKAVQAALDRLVDVGLALAFDHQGYRYLCQPDWQDFQRVGYPRLTTNPKPPANILRTFSKRTAEYFEKHPGGLAKDSANIPETLAESLPSSRARETLTAKANGQGSGERPMAQGSDERPTASASPSVDEGGAGNLWELFRTKAATLRGATLPLNCRNVEFSSLLDFLCRYPDPAKQDWLIDQFLTSSHRPIVQAPVSIGQLCKWAPWLEAQTTATVAEPPRTAGNRAAADEAIRLIRAGGIR